MAEIKNLKPECIWRNFDALTQVPRPSGHLEKVQQFLLDFGKKVGVEVFKDEAENIVMKKPATPGMENRKTILLQAHMDMVPQKAVDSTHNFETDPIQTYIDGEWVKAKGTTLGADDGIGVAAIMAVMEDKTLKHGPIEALITADEETGMFGAEGLPTNTLNSDVLLNLDSETWGKFVIGSAGGVDVTADLEYKEVETDANDAALQVTVKGLKGGHSGDDIDKKRANAIKILSRFLYMTQEKMDLRLVSFNSGKLHNAIPRDGKVVFAIPAAEKENVRAAWNVFAANVEDEFHVSDVEMEFYMQSTEAQPVIEKECSVRIIRALQAVDNGVYSMCQDKALETMVETSSNIAVVKTEENEIEVLASQRSNVMSNLDNECNTIQAVFQLAGAEVEQNDGYPAWKMKADSKLTKLAVDSYVKLFGKEPIVRGIHAGLECGLFSERYPNMDMVSFGPTLRFVHTPDEKLHIPTVQMVWDHLLDIMKNVPAK